MKHKTFRALLSLVLVCVLLIGWSPIRAQASVLGGTAVLFGDDAIAILLAVLGGLGVFAVADSETSDLAARSLARSAMDAMETAGKFVKNGALSVYTSLSEAWSYAVSTDLVQWLHDWLWTESGVMNPLCNSLTSEQIAALDGHMSAFCSAFGVSVVYGCYVDTGTGFQFALSKAPIILSGTVYKPSDGSVMWSLYATGTNTVIKQDGIILQFNPSGRTVHTFSGSSCVGLNADVELKSGVVAPPGTEIETEYGEYVVIVAPNGVPDTGGDGGDDEQPKIPVLPVPYLPPSEIPNVPQEDIWKGNKVEIDNPDTGDTPDPMPDTDIDIGTGTDGSLSQTPWETFKKWISEGWQSIIQAIPTPESIAEAVGNVIKSIFVPDADFISEKWNAIRSRFDFADSISSSGELILDVLNGIDPEPPVIYVDLGDAEGRYYLGGQVAFLDLRWYERYKPTGDAIISAFLWLVFVWRMFIKLPGIIGGLPGDFVMQGVTDLGLADWLPARKKEYENQRQENRRFFKK